MTADPNIQDAYDELYQATNRYSHAISTVSSTVRSQPYGELDTKLVVDALAEERRTRADRDAILAKLGVTVPPETPPDGPASR